MEFKNMNEPSPEQQGTPNSNSTKDEIFSQPQPAADFRFGKKVAAVFDDMVERSVPFYHEIQRMVAELAADFAVEGSNLYDLGCSTGTTLFQLDSVLPPGVRLIGVDNAPDMLDRCRAKLAERNFRRDHTLVCADLNQEIKIENASVVILMLTLQFIRPLHRDQLIRSIWQGLNENGCLIVVEKVLGEDSVFNRIFIKHYYDLKKRQGYSELEIAQKREALENVLIPYKLLENRELFLRTGFRYCDVFFKWYNFCGMVAVK
jgi:tRNA (cmo5U34)-methyltransferase